jgi:hypothetical protein
VLAVAWLLAAARDVGPYPVLALLGVHGAAKSSFTTILRSLVDPNTAPLRALPREDRDLFIAASNGHVMAFDNVSGLPNWVSDTLCRLATGGGFAVRQLYTDQDEVLFDASRPIILNGIEDFHHTTRPCRPRHLRGAASDTGKGPQGIAATDGRVRAGAAEDSRCFADALSCGLRRLPNGLNVCRAWPTSPTGRRLVNLRCGRWGTFAKAYDANRAEDEPVYMLTIDAKRGKHLHKWVPFMREARIDGFDANARPYGYSGDEVLTGINQHAGKGVFGHDYKDDIHNHWISTAIIRPKRIIRCAQVEFVIKGKAKDAA